MKNLENKKKGEKLWEKQREAQGQEGGPIRTAISAEKEIRLGEGEKPVNHVLRNRDLKLSTRED